MKKLLVLSLMLCLSIYCFSQTTARLTNIKDGWGTQYTYVGEVKNNKPNGHGVAIYTGSTALYHVGYFANGLFNGKGVMMFADGQFLSGDWKNGKLNGRGAYLNKDGDLYIGQFYDGEKEGNGTLFYKDNGFLTGQFRNDTYDGRVIFIAAKGEVLTDNIYQNNKKNGPGYQYESDTKKLFEGVWKDGNWVNAQTASYKSFMKNPLFYSEKTEKQILMGSVDKNNLLVDTAFFYDLKLKKRYFGLYEKGFLRNGLIIRDDSTRFLGALSDKGAMGYGSFYKVKKFYDEGIYNEDYLNGPDCLSIDVKSQTVYFGTMVKGSYTGKGFFIGKNKNLQVGDFVRGTFIGNGYRITSDGTFVKGTWDDGYSVKVTGMTDPSGKAIQITPKTLSDAIATLAELSINDFEHIRGTEILESEINNDNDDFYEVRNSVFTVPGAAKNYVVAGLLEGDAQISFYLKTTDQRKAFAKYNDLCKNVQSASIVKKGSTPKKLEGTVEKPTPNDLGTISKFYFPGEDQDYDFHVCVVLKKEGDEYKVYMTFGNAEMIQTWFDGE